jgi:hypothetical protein
MYFVKTRHKELVLLYKMSTQKLIGKVFIVKQINQLRLTFVIKNKTNKQNYLQWWGCTLEQEWSSLENQTAPLKWWQR